MRKILRTLLYVTLALYAAQQLIGTFSYTEDRTVVLSILGLCLLYFFLKPLISIVSLPTKGSMYFLISFISTALVFYALTNVLADLSFEPITLHSLTILGFVLPSKDLTGLWAMIFSALTTSTVYLFLESLCKKR